MRSKKETNIILLEDDDIDAKGIERAFKKSKIANPIHRAENGEVAIDMLESNKNGIMEKSKIFLVDLNMPRMSGIEFIKYAREKEELKKSIIFVLTTSSHERDIMSAYDLNVAGYILKENAGADFLNLLDLLESYWRVVEIPE